MLPPPSVVRTLVNATIAVFVLELGGGEGMIDAFALWPLHAGFMPWQLVSYAFLHGSAAHLAFNMLGLWMFWRELEHRLGP